MTENAIDLAKEFSVIAGAPVSFATAVILATGIVSTVIYFILKSRYQGQIDTQGAHIELLKNQIETRAEEPAAEQLAPAEGRADEDKSATYDPTWEKIDGFALWQAAWLWIGKEPHPEIPAGSPAYPAFTLLKQAAIQGNLKTLITGNLEEQLKARRAGSSRINAWTMVTKDELRKFAESRGEHPDFLQD